MELFWTCVRAFVVGGAICTVGQVLIDYTKLTPARILVSFVVSGVILTALGVYEPIVEFAESGATVPLTGFGYSLAKGVQEAVLEYETLGRAEGLSLVKIKLLTGRTHQIRCQFASRGMPLVGERKYSTLQDDCPIALWSNSISFYDMDGKQRIFSSLPPQIKPWTLFNEKFI